MQSRSKTPAFSVFMQEALKQLESCTAANVTALSLAAEQIAARLHAGGRFFGFGCGHSGLVSQDAYYRAGGLKGYQHMFAPLVELSVEPVAQSSVEEKRSGWIDSHLESFRINENDCVIVISTSGVNAVPVEAALHCQSRGALVIGITSTAASSALDARHPSGKKLMDLSDFLLDNGSPYGDTLVDLGTSEHRMGSASTAVGCILLQSLNIAVQEAAIAAGSPLSTYVSGNIPGGMEKNQEGT
ncbi:MAG: putative phosphosugar-binding protein [Planctomycetota bacterium]|jgi:uncharacterized phosphosugar-binding protein